MDVFQPKYNSNKLHTWNYFKTYIIGSEKYFLDNSSLPDEEHRDVFGRMFDIELQISSNFIAY